MISIISVRFLMNGKNKNVITRLRLLIGLMITVFTIFIFIFGVNTVYSEPGTVLNGLISAAAYGFIAISLLLLLLSTSTLFINYSTLVTVSISISLSPLV